MPLDRFKALKSKFITFVENNGFEFFINLSCDAQRKKNKKGDTQKKAVLNYVFIFEELEIRERKTWKMD